MLFDRGGYVLFRTKDEFDSAVQAGHIVLRNPTEADGKRRMHVTPDISSLPNYVLYLDHEITDSESTPQADVDLVKLLLDRGFARHRIAALFDVDQQIINDIAADRVVANAAETGDC